MINKTGVLLGVIEEVWNFEIAAFVLVDVLTCEDIGDLFVKSLGGANGGGISFSVDEVSRGLILEKKGKRKDRSYVMLGTGIRGI